MNDECSALTTRSLANDVITNANKHELILNTYDRKVGQVVILDCYQGFTLRGAKQVECLAGGNWNFANKPYCDDGETTPSPEITDEQKIIIAVVCGVAGLILLVLLLMCLYVHCYGRKIDRRPKSGLSRDDIALYARQHSSYNDGRRDEPNRRDFDKYSRDYDGSEYGPYRSRGRGDDWGSSQLGYGMSLPRDTRGSSRPHYPPPYMSRGRGDDWGSSQLGYGMYLPRDTRGSSRPDYPPPYDAGYGQPWISSGSVYGSDPSMRKFDLPAIHGGGERNLWRSTRRY